MLEMSLKRAWTSLCRRRSGRGAGCEAIRATCVHTYTHILHTHQGQWYFCTVVAKSDTEAREGHDRRGEAQHAVECRVVCRIGVLPCRCEVQTAVKFQAGVKIASPLTIVITRSTVVATIAVKLKNVDQDATSTFTRRPCACNESASIPKKCA